MSEYGRVVGYTDAEGDGSEAKALAYLAYRDEAATLPPHDPRAVQVIFGPVTEGLKVRPFGWYLDLR